LKNKTFQKKKRKTTTATTTTTTTTTKYIEGKLKYKHLENFFNFHVSRHTRAFILAKKVKRDSKDTCTHIVIVTPST